MKHTVFVGTCTIVGPDKIKEFNCTTQDNGKVLINVTMELNQNEHNPDTFLKMLQICGLLEFEFNNVY